MKKLLSTIGLAVLMTLTVAAMWAAQIDGKWKAEQQVKSKKGEATVVTTFDVKSEGETVTGSVTTNRGRKDRSAAIKSGKVEGNRFQFTVVETTKKGESEMHYSGTVEGDELKGTASKKAGKRGNPFTAKRQ